MVLFPIVLMATTMTRTQVPKHEEFSMPIVKLLEAAWPNNRTFTIVCHGHSVPAGYFQTPVVQPFDSYPHLLHLVINNRFPKAVVNVIVTAIGGENSESGAKRFEKDVINHRPDVVTIDYGLNDRGIGLERAKVAWESMIDLAQKAGAKVILLTPSWDQTGDVSIVTDPLQLHAKQIRELAAKHGTGLADSFDSFLAFKRNGGEISSLMSQSNHPNRAGHELILRGLRPWFGLLQP